MKMRISMFCILAMVASIRPMEIRQPLEQNPAILIAEIPAILIAASPQGSFDLAATLAPLKEEAQAIQQKIKAFDALLQQESWDEVVLKKVLEEYQELDEEIDVFPLRYQQLLSEVRFGYRMDRNADQLLGEHSALYCEVTFGLFKYRRMIADLTTANRIFKDVRSGMGSVHVPFSLFWVDDLKKYQRLAFSEYEGLQGYLNETAGDLLLHLSQGALYKAPQKKVQQKHALAVLDSELEQEESEMCQNFSMFKNMLRKTPLEEGDLQELSGGYQKLLDAKNRLQLFRESAPQCAFSKYETHVKKGRKLEQLYHQCFQAISTCERFGVKDLKEILAACALAEKVAQQKCEKKQNEDRWFLAGARKKGLVPQILIGEPRDRVSLFLGWSSQSKPLQEAVRAQVKKVVTV